MALTTAELRVAADRAETYSPGFGYVWGDGGGLQVSDPDPVLELLRSRPGLAAHG